MNRFFLPRTLLVTLIVAAALSAPAQPAIQPAVDITQVPAAAQPSPQFDVDAATEAYMAMMPPAAVARSNAYFEGGYWLILWDFLYGAAISLLLLATQLVGPHARPCGSPDAPSLAQILLYWLQYLVVTTLLGLPLEWYEGLFREQQYGLATQTLRPLDGRQLKGSCWWLVLIGLAILLLFAIVRRFPQTWWIWGSLAGIAIAIVGIAIGPVYIQPMFNKITKLNDPKVTAPILRLAHANGIPTNDVYQIDASRQTTRMSANVSGFADTTRITLNDNLLRRGSPEEIRP